MPAPRATNGTPLAGADPHDGLHLRRSSPAARRSAGCARHPVSPSQSYVASCSGSVITCVVADRRLGGRRRAAQASGIETSLLRPDPTASMIDDRSIVHHGSRRIAHDPHHASRQDRLRRAQLQGPRRGAGRRPAGQAPLFFAKYTTSLIGPGDADRDPVASSTKCDYEAELGVVIGRHGQGRLQGERVRGGRRLRRRERRLGPRPPVRRRPVDARQVARHVLPGRPARARVRGAPTRTRSGSARSSTGRRVQDSTTANLIFGIDEIISYASQTSTLEAGDLILTGTPAGVGVFRDPQRLLQPGDDDHDRDRRGRVADEPGGRRRP